MPPRKQSSPQKTASGRNMTVREASMVLNTLAMTVGGDLYGRMNGYNGRGTNPDPRRDIDKECGYLTNPTVRDYAEVYERSGLAARVVNLLPDECWAVHPDIYETEKPRNTPFEKKVMGLMRHPDLNLNYFLHKADAVSGIGRAGLLLMGIDDGKPLDTILDGVQENGQARPKQPKGRNLLYLRALDETYFRVKTTDGNGNSPRFGLPSLYEIQLEEVDSSGVRQIVTRDVHWSRAIHVAEARGSSEIWADPKLKKVFDQITDCRKILGGSGEMFWKGGFPGVAATVDPRFLEAGGIEIDEETITDEMQRYMDGLQRYILGVGFQVNSISPQVADPTAHLMMQFTVIAMSLGIPLRVFMGSEQAKLASGQDIKAWNKRLSRRQNDYLTPRLIRPFIHRLMMAGVIPMTKELDDFGYPIFNVWWPDVAMPDDNERSTIADRRSAAMMKYVMGGSYQLMQPSDFLHFVLGYNYEEVDQILSNAKRPPEIKFKDPTGTAAAKSGKKAGKPGDSGVKGSPPSDTRPR